MKNHGTMKKKLWYYGKKRYYTENYRTIPKTIYGNLIYYGKNYGIMDKVWLYRKLYLT